MLQTKLQYFSLVSVAEQIDISHRVHTGVIPICYFCWRPGRYCVKLLSTEEYGFRPVGMAVGIGPYLYYMSIVLLQSSANGIIFVLWKILWTPEKYHDTVVDCL